MDFFCCIGNVLAGGDLSKVLVGGATAILTGGASLALGAPIGAAIGTGAAAGAAAVSGGRIGMQIGAQNNAPPAMYARISDNHGHNWESVATRKEVVLPNPFPRSISEENRQAEYDEARLHLTVDDESRYNFGVAMIDNEKYYWRKGNGGTFITGTERSNWVVSNRRFERFSYFPNQPRNLTFEETFLTWFFAYKYLYGTRYVEAWTNTGLRFLVPENENHRIGSSEWERKKFRLQRELAAQREQEQAEEEALQEVFKESEWGMYETLKAANDWSFRESDPSVSRAQACARATLHYYNLGINLADTSYRPMLEKVVAYVIPGGIDNLINLAEGRISGWQFTQNVLTDMAGYVPGLGFANFAYKVTKTSVRAAKYAVNFSKNLGNGKQQYRSIREERVCRTELDLFNYFQRLKKQANWRFYRKSPDGKHTAYINSKTGEIRYNDNLHNEVECFDRHHKHSVLDPVTEQVLNKPPHSFPNWLK